MKRLILPVLVFVALHPIPGHAQETNSMAEAEKPQVSEEAWKILTRMSEYISGKDGFTIVAEMGHQVLQKNGQWLESGSRITAALRRPSHANVRFEPRDSEGVTVILDGETISVSSVIEGTFVYDITRQTGDIDTSFDYLTEMLGTNDQLRNFFSIRLTDTLRSLVKSGYAVGEATIDGVLCDNLALRSETEDVQIWISKGSNPAPRRMIVTRRTIEGEPQFWAQFLAWNFSPDFSDSMFTFSPPEDAERLDFLSQ